MKPYSFVHKVNGETNIIYNLTLHDAVKHFEAARVKGHTAFQVYDAETGSVVVKSSQSEARVFHTLHGLIWKRSRVKSVPRRQHYE